MRIARLHILTFIFLLASGTLGACARAAREAPRHGDEIVVCGRYFRIGAPVVLWTDPGGYDAYRTEKRFVPWDRAAWTPPAPGGRTEGVSTPNRYSIRFASAIGKPGCPLNADEFERIRGGGWDLPTLQRVVDQFVIHYDVCGTSRQCFRVLHDLRGLSVHFMLDVDGTIYQTLDLKERAWHATSSNDRSIGVEIANIGAYPTADAPPLRQWYASESGGGGGRCVLTVPPVMGDGGVRSPGFVGRPIRPGPVQGVIQGQTLWMYDLTPEQYESLTRLTAALCTIFPNMPCDIPRDDAGKPLCEKLPDDELAAYRGVLGHYHIQSNKTDPGPAFQWERVIEGARRRAR